MHPGRKVKQLAGGDYEQARIIAYSVHSEHVERDFMQRVFEEADKCRPLLIEEVVNSERTPNEFVNEPRGNGEKNKISSLEAVRKRRERTKSEPREFSKNGYYLESYRALSNTKLVSGFT